MLSRKLKITWRTLTTSVLLLTSLFLYFAVGISERFADLFFTLTKDFNSSYAMLFAKIDFSVSEYLLFATVLGFFIYTIWAIIMSMLERSMKTLGKYFGNLILMVSAFVFIFTLFWGANYSAKNTLASKLGIQSSGGQTESQLYNTALILAEKANEYALLVGRGDSGNLNCFDFESSTSQLTNVFGNLSSKYEMFSAKYYAQPKKVQCYSILSYLGIQGIYSPFTAETNINTNIPKISIPFIMCHETLHRLGVMQEDEANFGAFFAGINSDNVEFTYSAYFMAYVYVVDSLYTENEQLAESVMESQNFLLSRDVFVYSKSGQKYDTNIKAIGNAINNLYIKTMGDNDGITSYGKMIDLICSYYCQDTGLNEV